MRHLLTLTTRSPCENIPDDIGIDQEPASGAHNGNPSRLDLAW